MQDYLASGWPHGNPSSGHSYGQKAKALVEESRSRVCSGGSAYHIADKDRTLWTTPQLGTSGMKSARIRNGRQKNSRGCATGYPFSFQKFAEFSRLEPLCGIDVGLKPQVPLFHAVKRWRQAGGEGIH